MGNNAEGRIGRRGEGIDKFKIQMENFAPIEWIARPLEKLAACWPSFKVLRRLKGWKQHSINHFLKTPKFEFLNSKLINNYQ